MKIKTGWPRCEIFFGEVRLYRLEALPGTNRIVFVPGEASVRYKIFWVLFSTGWSDQPVVNGYFVASVVHF